MEYLRSSSQIMDLSSCPLSFEHSPAPRNGVSSISLAAPQSNGVAERAIRTEIDILRQDIFLALLTYHSMPVPDLGVSPAELAMGRKLRISMPTLPSMLMPHTINYDRVWECDHAFKQHQKQCFDHHHGTWPLPELHPGDPVLLKRDGKKEWKWPAEVVHLVTPHSYLLHTDGGELKHNCKHIRMHPVHVQQPASSQTPSTYGQHQSASILQSTASCNSWLLHQTWFGSLHLQDSHHPQSTVLVPVRQCTLQQDSWSSCSTSRSPSVNQHCAEYVRVAKVKACECDHSDGYFHFILVIVHTQKQELMKISW